MFRKSSPLERKNPGLPIPTSGLLAGAPAPGRIRRQSSQPHGAYPARVDPFQRGYLNTAHKHAEMEMIAKGQARAPVLPISWPLAAIPPALTSISPQMRIKRHHAQTVINNKQVAINAHFAGKDNPTIIGRRNFRIAYGSQIKARCQDSQSAFALIAEIAVIRKTGPLRLERGRRKKRLPRELLRPYRFSDCAGHRHWPP